MVEKFPTSSSRNFSYSHWSSSLSRVRGYNPASAAQFFFLIYESGTHPIQHNPARLYSCDKTGITIVRHKHTIILGVKGKRQISSVQPADRGSLVKVVTCLSPIGHFIPPLLVFPRKYMKQELMNGTPPGSIYVCHFLGWIQNKIFTQWFLHFITHRKPTK
jgi:hypothetical protein